MKHFILSAVIGLFAMFGATQAVAQAPAPTGPAVAAVSAEDLAALAELRRLLALATTAEQRSAIIARAIALRPSLASNPAASNQVQTLAIQSGLSVAQIDSAVITGLSQAAAPAAGGQQQAQPTLADFFPEFSSAN